ncbi:transaldolase [Fontimonas thermophila]|uniref:Transaldolase n=1 Tax=Fontimonas thermophila TaxID=1076937 RepID=A0A1I2IPB0_9GAMM|nr:transaldolase [Fontimonas thermophila]SFF43473.1 transaldolase [Fontimonas thermophila]
MNPLLECQRLGQSIWLDFIARKLLDGDGLQRLIDADGISGLTSNPAIFEKAIGGSDEYDAELAALVAMGVRDPQDLYEQLAITDIRRAADRLRLVYERSGGADGYVSLEVSPHLALDEDATVRAAQRLWRAVDRPNLMIKVPGTAPGIAAVRRLIGEGINVNVTLLFARSAYRAVADAYADGLEAFAAAGGEIGRVASVASFFISRIDTAMDTCIEQRIASTHDDHERTALRALLGRVAIANARLAYADYRQLTAQPRWQALAARGARPQRLLWASTSTKNPAYRDVYYVEALIGPDTVNTLPPATLDAFRDHGCVRASLLDGLDEAQATMAAVEHWRLPLDEVADRLLTEGLRLFVDAHDRLVAAIAAKRDALRVRPLAGACR